MVVLKTFQSTLSMRRATGVGGFEHFVPAEISIHALHEESDRLREQLDNLAKDISIHALHEESDRLREQLDNLAKDISIHALHEESDRAAGADRRPVGYFNPRSP